VQTGRRNDETLEVAFDDEGVVAVIDEYAARNWPFGIFQHRHLSAAPLPDKQ
jgi:hypothetical protein